MRSTVLGQPRYLVAVVILVLGCCFGLASVATPTRLPLIQNSVEPVEQAKPTKSVQSTHTATHASTRILPTHITPWVHVRVESGDTLSGLFASLGLGPSQWMPLLELDTEAQPLKHLVPGDSFRLRKTPDGRLAALVFPYTGTDTLIVRRTNKGLSAKVHHVSITRRRILVRGTVGQSFPRSLSRAGVPAEISFALAHLYEWRHDLSHTMSPGDQFSIIYVAEYTEGRRISVGPIIAASIQADGHTWRAFRHVSDDGEVHYYDLHGRSYEPSIQRTPLNYLYVSSPFNMHRMHPILNVVRPHTGVDLAAPGGTPVHAAADGAVVFVGWVSGYGRIVKLEHPNGYSTWYAHLSAFANSLDEGEHVSQGQVIGYVGQSGTATGYHLHYEIRLHGVPHNPLTMRLPSSAPLNGEALANFTDHIQPLIARLDRGDNAPSTLVAARSPKDSTNALSDKRATGALTLAGELLEPTALDEILCMGSRWRSGEIWCRPGSGNVRHQKTG